MNFAALTIADLAGLIVGLFLTLTIFSYLLADNALFRFAIHIFVGVASGYAVIMAWYNVIWPLLALPWESGNFQLLLLFVIPPLLLGVLLLAKAIPRLSGLGNIPLAFMVGVGAATIIGGAIMGTLLPQTFASINQFSWSNLQQSDSSWLSLINGSIILIGTITTMIYFQFSARSHNSQANQGNSIIEGLAHIGQIFIAIALGVLFAGVYAAALTALVERWDFLAVIVKQFLPR